ncbi:MAG: hypothetical protein ACNA8W_01315 [Bradymonadaceae bacterium]
MTNSTARLLLVGLLIAGLSACSGDFYDEGASGGIGSPSDNNEWGGNAPGQNNDDGNNASNNGFIPEEEVEFDFAAPAVIGDQVYVANETLNSVAVIDSHNLSVKTILVGPRPTDVVGPVPEHSLEETARVMSLNQGNDTVTIIDPVTHATKIVRVLSEANALMMDPRGRFAVVWFDDVRADEDDRRGDLSTVTVVTAEESFQVAVGFHVRRVQFSDDGTRAVVLTDDGISVIALDGLTQDTFAPPVAIVPPNLAQLKPVDLDVRISDDGRWAITRTSAYRGLILLDIDENIRSQVSLPESPTDIKLFGQGAELEILAMLPRRDQMLRATVPAGLLNAAEWTQEQIDNAPPPPPPEADAGHVDAGHDDVGFNDADTGFADAEDDVMGDADLPDAQAPDADLPDADLPDADLPDADLPDADLPDADLPDVQEPVDLEPWPEFEGFVFHDLIIPSLGVSGISHDASTALLFTTLNQERRAVLYNLETDEQRSILFEKGIRGILPDARGRTFIVFHSRLEGRPPAGLSPTDPLYIAHSWGFSVVDIASGATRLILTQQEPGQTALWSSEDADEDAQVFMIFKHPTYVSGFEDSHRDVVSVNLRSFRMDSFRVSSLPDGLGAIRGARKLYISQVHPQGRLSFLDVDTRERQTVTGYQLNAGIY